MLPKPISGRDPEIDAISQVNAALKGLEAGTQQRVLDYVARKLGLVFGVSAETGPADDEPEPPRSAPAAASRAADEPDGLDEISADAKKWMKRSGLTADKLGTIFSIGGDEIDLIAKKVPRKTSAIG